MEGKARERWCMLRCTGVAQDNNEVINRTMLRFRPIAPKPATNDTVSGLDNKNLLLSGKRSKRKYVRVRKNNGYKRKNRISPNEVEDDGLNLDKTVVTLQLLPEKTDHLGNSNSDSNTNSNSNSNSNATTQEPWCNMNLDAMVGSKGALHVHHEMNRDKKLPVWLNREEGFGVADQTTVVVSQRRIVVESWVTVEGVTDTCMDGRGLAGSTDVERMNNLENDTCPGFISDGLNRVQWVNEAYKKMVMGVGSLENNNEAQQSPEITVGLITKEKLPTSVYSSFTTRVRLQYTWQKEKYSKMVPCDVFRMDCGKFAWRLDIEAALSLGR